MNSIYSFAHGKTKQQYNSLRYRKCKRKLFRKKCRWATKSVPRGLYHNEIMIMIKSLQNQAHTKAIEKLKTYELQKNSLENSKKSKIPIENFENSENFELDFLASGVPTGFSQVLTGVENKDIEKAVGYMLEKANNSILGRKIRAGVNTGRNHLEFVHYHDGVKYDIQVTKLGKSYRVTLNSV